MPVSNPTGQIFYELKGDEQDAHYSHYIHFGMEVWMAFELLLPHQKLKGYVEWVAASLQPGYPWQKSEKKENVVKQDNFNVLVSFSLSGKNHCSVRLAINYLFCRHIGQLNKPHTSQWGPCMYWEFHPPINLIIKAMHGIWYSTNMQHYQLFNMLYMFVCTLSHVSESC